MKNEPDKIRNLKDSNQKSTNLKAVSITGFKNSGKTTLTLHLARALEARGLCVGVAKRSHHPLDKPGTDTGRLRAPGRTVLGITESESALFWGEEKDLSELLPLMDVDILLLEGGKSRDWLPRILCLHEAAEAEALHRGLAIASFGDVPATEHDAHLPHFTAENMDALAALVEEKAFALPGLDCGACGHEGCLGLARLLVRGEGSIADCVALNSDVHVRINGHEVGLNPFTARVIGGAVRGMLRELKGAGPGTAEITLKL